MGWWKKICNPGNNRGLTWIVGVASLLIAMITLAMQNFTPPLNQEGVQNALNVNNGSINGDVTQNSGIVTNLTLNVITPELLNQYANSFQLSPSALEKLFTQTNIPNVPPENVDKELRDWAEKYQKIKNDTQALQTDNPETTELKKRAENAFQSGDIETAKQALKEASQIDLQHASSQEKNLTELRKSAALSQASIGDILMMQSSYSEAIDHYKQALVIFSENTSLITADFYRKLADALLSTGDAAQAEDPAKKALSLYEKTFGSDPGSWMVVDTLNLLGAIYRDQDRYAEAEESLKKSLHILRASKNLDKADTLEILAGIYEKQNKYKDAIPLYLSSLEIYKMFSGMIVDSDFRSDVVRIAHKLSADYEKLNQRDQSLQYDSLALSLEKQMLGNRGARMINAPN